MAILMIPSKVKMWKNDGVPAVGWKLWFYAAGTTTPKDTWTDEAGIVTNANPVRLDSRGEALIRLKGSYKVELTDENDNQIWVVDNQTQYDQRDWSGLTATIAELNATNTSVLTKTSDYPIIMTDRGKTVAVDATAATPTTVTLLNATTATNGYQITIKKTDKTNNIVNIDAQITQKIDGLDTFVLYDYKDFVKILSDGSNWHVIAGRLRGSAIATTTTPLVIDLGDEHKTYLIDASSSAFTVNLPAINTVARGYKIGFKKTDSSSNAVTINGDGTEQIDGGSSIVLIKQFDFVVLITDGVNWFVTGEYGSETEDALPKDYRSGILLVNNVTDTQHDIDFLAGKWRNSDDTHDLILLATITKRIDANWTAGTNGGGFPTLLTLSVDTDYHCFIIGKPNGTIDAGYDSDLSAANLLNDATGYTEFVRVHTVRTEKTTTNLLQFVMFYIGKFRETYWKDPTLDVDTTDPGTAAVLAVVKTPLGVSTLAVCNIVLTEGGEMYVSNPAQSDLPPSFTAAPLGQLHDATSSNVTSIEVMTDTTSQLRYRISESNGSTKVGISTIGWKE